MTKKLTRGMFPWTLLGIAVCWNRAIVQAAPFCDPNKVANRSLNCEVLPLTSATGDVAQTALRVLMIDLQNPQPPNAVCCPPQDFSAFEVGTCTAAGESAGCGRWVGPPQMFLEKQDKRAKGGYFASRLQCTPYYHDWTLIGGFSIFGAEIVPSSAYELVAYASSCKGVEPTCTDVSTPVTTVTRRWGDVAAAFNPPSITTQPDAIDVTVMGQKFTNQPGSPPNALTKVRGTVPDLFLDVDALDVNDVNDAFNGVAFPYSGPCVCPPTVSCGAVTCTSPVQCTAFGPGATCVRTCVGGPNSGLQCKADKHCNLCPGGSPFAGLFCDPTVADDCGGPGFNCPSQGACGPGSCRDRCERCN